MYRADSPLREKAEAVYEALYGKPLQVLGVHAGLENGAFAQKWPDVDMISIGPTIRGEHTPEETLDIASYEKFYEYLKALLASLCQKGAE